MQVDHAQPQLSTLSDYIAVIKRRKWVIIQALVIVPIAAVALSLHQHKLFQSSAQVYISRQNPSSNLTGTPDPSLFEPADRFMQTQVDLARARPIADQVVKQVPGHGLTPSRFLGASSVTELTNADILVLSVTNANAALSRQLATAYANAFAAYRSQLNITSLQTAQKQLQARLGQLRKQGIKSGTLYTNLASRNDLLTTMIALGTSSAHVIQQPTGSAQIQPKPSRDGLIGVALGLIIGLALAFLLEALDSRARNPEDISARLGGLPLLARLPRPERRLRSKKQRPALAGADALQADAFRMLRTQLDLARLENPTKTIMVTSALDQEGKSTTAANLATALARAGRRVVLVDLDLYRPAVHEIFSLSGPGVTDVALGVADLSTALVPISTAGQLGDGSLEVLPAGQMPQDPGDFVNAPALREVLRRLEERADTVIIDTSPLLQAGDAMTLSTQVDGLLLVVRNNVLRKRMLDELARVLERTPATKLGFVLTDVAPESGYGYGYRRGYAPIGKASATQVTQ